MVDSSPNLTYRRFWQALGWLAVGVVIALTVMREPPRISVPVLGWDKAQHLIAYAGLMWWFRQAFAARAKWMIFLAALGILLEGVQRLTDARHFEFYDMLANMAGIGLGVLLTTTPLGRTLAWAEGHVVPRRFVETRPDS